MEPKQAIITAHEANKAKESYFQEKLLPQIDQMIRSASSSGKDDVIVTNCSMYFSELEKIYKPLGFEVYLIKDSSTIKIVWGNLVPQPSQEPIEEPASESNLVSDLEYYANQIKSATSPFSHKSKDYSIEPLLEHFKKACIEDFLLKSFLKDKTELPFTADEPTSAKSIRNSFPYQNDLYARTKEEKLGNMFYALEHVTQTLEEISKEEDNDILIEELFQTFRTDYFFRLFRETFKRGNEKKENAEIARIVKNVVDSNRTTSRRDNEETQLANEREDFSLEIIQQKTKSVVIEKLVENWNRGIRFAAERGNTDFSIDLSNYDGRKDEISSYYRNKGFNVSLNTLNGLNLMKIYWFQSIS